MSLYQFIALDETEQIETIWDKGVYLGERKDMLHLYKLYQIDGFYVEEKWDIALNTRRGFITFNSMERLEPYLRKIDIIL